MIWAVFPLGLYVTILSSLPSQERPSFKFRKSHDANSYILPFLREFPAMPLPGTEEIGRLRQMTGSSTRRQWWEKRRKGEYPLIEKGKCFKEDKILSIFRQGCKIIEFMKIPNIARVNDLWLEKDPFCSYLMRPNAKQASTDNSGIA